MALEHKLATAEKRVLVELVKLVQKRHMKGEKGEWKEFLDIYDKKFGSSLSDPSKRPRVVLAAFLMTFEKDGDRKFFARFLQCEANRVLMEKFKHESAVNETPEQRLVRLTLEHPEFPLEYAFPSYAEDWFVTRPGMKTKMRKSIKMIAVDCEMVLCEDGTEAVARVAVVDRKLKVKLDKLVNPNKPVADFRTDITGLTAVDIEKASLTLADIQKKIRRFLPPGTIIVGHSLNYDLQVLKIDHVRVIDTSLVYKYPFGHKRTKPSLSNLCKSILGYELRKEGAPHDCVHDAKAAMELALAVIDKGVDTTLTVTHAELKDKMSRLLLHRIPHCVPSQELHGLLSGSFILDVRPPKTHGGYYRAVANFKTSEEANEAFENLEGCPAKDSSDLPQKLIFFEISSGKQASLYVRKMVRDDSFPSKRSCPDVDINGSKKQKIDNESVETVAADADRCYGGKLTEEKTEEKRIEKKRNCPDTNTNDSKKQKIDAKSMEIVAADADRCAGDKLTEEKTEEKRIEKKRSCPDTNTNDSENQKIDDECMETVAADVDGCDGDKIDTPSKSETKEKTEEQKIEKGSHCEEHFKKEIEELKQKLKEKDFQLKTQDTIIDDLRKKLGRKKKAQ